MGRTSVLTLLIATALAGCATTDNYGESWGELVYPTHSVVGYRSTDPLSLPGRVTPHATRVPWMHRRSAQPTSHAPMLGSFNQNYLTGPVLNPTVIRPHLDYPTAVPGTAFGHAWSACPRTK